MLRFDEKVAIVTGGGQGLGRAYARYLAQRGARVVVNDVGHDLHGAAAAQPVAQSVAAEIRAAGGEAIGCGDSVEDGGRIVQCALDTYGRLDVVINNAGIVRDRAFHNLSDEDWESVFAVHVLGAVRVTQAAWAPMRRQKFGRVVMTSSASAFHGNFGQANYTAAKAALIGLGRTLALEGARHGILVNCVAPAAGSRMAAEVMPADLLAALKPEYVAPFVAYLCHAQCQHTGAVFEIGAGWIGQLRWQRSEGIYLDAEAPDALERIARSFGQLDDFTRATHPQTLADAFEPLRANPRVAAALEGFLATEHHEQKSEP